MTDKQIMIDGINVSECPYYIDSDGSCSSHDCECIKCVHNACFYKDLKAKEQECEELKKQHNGDKGLITSTGKMNYQLIQEYDKLKQTFSEIKEILKEICMEECSFDWNKTNKKHCGDCDCRYGRILQKISKCEENNDMENN